MIDEHLFDVKAGNYLSTEWAMHPAWSVSALDRSRPCV